MDIINLLSSDGYIVVNKTLAKKFGLQAAVLIGELCSEHKYWESQNKLEDGYFYSTQDNIEKNTTIGASQQKRIIDKLEEAGIVSTKLMGVPAKKYYKLNEEALFLAFDDSSIAKSSKLESSNRVLNNNKKTIIKEDITTTINSSSRNFEDDYTQHSYSMEELKADNFLGSAKSYKKPKKKSLYSQCVDEIDLFTQNLKLRTLLIDYLNFRLEVKDKPIYFNQWKGMLKKLKTLGTDDTYIDIVQQSLDKGWLSFYELKTFNSSADKFAEFGDVITEHKEEEYVDRVF